MPLYAINDDLMYRISLKNTTLILEEKHGLKSTWNIIENFLEVWIITMTKILLSKRTNINYNRVLIKNIKDN